MGAKSSSCDLFEGGEITHRDTELSTNSSTFVLKYEDGVLIDGINPKNCSEWFNLNFGDEDLIDVIGLPFGLSLLISTFIFAIWLGFDYL